MIYEIVIPGSDFTGQMYGLTWIGGTCRTEDGYTAGRLKARGYLVTKRAAKKK